MENKFYNTNNFVGNEIRNNKLVNDILVENNFATTNKNLLVYALPNACNLNRPYTQNKQYYELMDCIIAHRYRNKDYQVMFVVFAGMLEAVHGLTVMPQDKIIQDHNYDTETYSPHKIDDNALTNKIKNLEQYKQVTVCGFHVSDCVLDLALSINKKVKDVKIDADLTELFESRVLNDVQNVDSRTISYTIEPQFDIKNYNYRLGQEKLFSNLTNNMSRFYPSYVDRMNDVFNIYGFSFDAKKSLAERITNTSRQECNIPIMIKDDSAQKCQDFNQ